ncbi:DUF2007 domain-containing protein [Teredinibacter waterburyi]|jgi:hypothetical protein|uniref:putative signal transducing protein n=1 Tax=Teredinibacter waterburyi TaxID=1500538 RepID=UPI00165F3816|nr:DUF2007 domain-containing protein [Teredinibacter waterburyi]
MIKIYDATNALEAHLILDKLEHAGLSGQVNGEYLQGGVGELQAIGIVQVMIDEDDYQQGLDVIKEWESSGHTHSEIQSSSQSSSRSTLISIILLSVVAITVIAGTLASLNS